MCECARRAVQVLHGGLMLHVLVLPSVAIASQNQVLLLPAWWAWRVVCGGCLVRGPVSVRGVWGVSTLLFASLCLRPMCP